MFNDVNDNIGSYLKIAFDDSGDLSATFDCQESFQGYDGMLHGGMIAAIIDSAMAKCLMGHGIIGYTGRMNIRYIKPVRIKELVTLNCRIMEHYKKVYKVEAEMMQDVAHKVLVAAQASFYKVNTSL